MIHLTLAIADFMGILIGAVLAAALSTTAIVLLAAGAIVASLWAGHRLVRRILRR